MSLINKMLRDLDERRASDLEREGIARHVRALPQPRTLRWQGPALALAGAVAGALLVWVAMDLRERAPTVAAMRPVPVTQPSPPLPASAPAASAPIPAGAAVIPKTETVTGVVRSSEMPRPPNAVRGVEKGEGGLKLDRGLEIGGRALVQEPSPRPQPTRIEEGGDARIEKQPRTPVISEAADAEYRKGMSALKRGAAQEAVTALDAALRIDQRHLLARQALLSLYVEQKRWKEAIELGSSGLVADPKQTGWAMLVARLQFEQGDPGAALATLAEHVRYAERNGEYLAFHALMLHKAGRYREAAERYRMALALRPTEGRWWYGLGIALEADQRGEEARQAWRQARATGNLPPELAQAVELKLHP